MINPKFLDRELVYAEIFFVTIQAFFAQSFGKPVMVLARVGNMPLQYITQANA
jgi:hypothetical protein